MAGLDQAAAALLPVIITGKGPGEGARLLRQMRKAGAANPILVIEDAATPDAISRTLDLGADDALAAPCAPIEVVARLRSITRRQFDHRIGEVVAGDLVVFLDGRHPEVAGLAVRLSARENEILRMLALNAGQVVRREVLFDALYALSDYQPHMKALDVHICKLRKKIDAASPRAESWIKTYNGAGYALTLPAP